MKKNIFSLAAAAMGRKADGAAKSAASKIMSAPAQAAGTAPTMHPVDAPADRGPLEYGRAQVAGLVIVEGQNVFPIPPAVYAAVREPGEGGGIIALIGPENVLENVQDAVVMSQAYPLRAALRELLEFQAKLRAGDTVLSADHDAAIVRAQAVLDKADPQFMSMQPVGLTAEERLANAREKYDPSLNQSTAGILADENFNVERAMPTLDGHDLVPDTLAADTRPSSSDPA